MSFNHNIFRLGVLLSALAGLLYVGCTTQNSGKVPENRPNILLIVTDQQSWLSQAGRQIVDMPTMDSLRSRGVTFTNYYTTSPQCTPSRSTLQTGLYPHQTQHVSNLNKAYNAPIPSYVNFLAQKMVTAGYQTGYGGKWHMKPDMESLGIEHNMGGGKRENSPDVFWRFLNSIDKQEPWFYQAHLINPHDIYNFKYIFEGATLEGDGKWIEQRRNRIEQQREDVRAYYEKHRGEITLPPGWDNPVEGVPDPIGDWGYPFNNSGEYSELTHEEKRAYWIKYKALYYMLNEQVDATIGGIIDVLRIEHPELFENTIVIYTSDHGDLSGNHESLKYKGPLPYDWQINVPLVMAGPGIPENTVVNELASLVDLPATIADMGGAEPPNAGMSDARSLWPAIRGKGSTRRNYIFSEYYFLGAVQPIRMIRSRSYKYAYHYAEDKPVLFELNSDPWERENLAGEAAYREVENRLKEDLLQWQQETNDPVRPDNYVIDAWKNPTQN